MLIDTHCHLNHARMAEDVVESLARAEVAGVERMITVGYDLESSREALRLAEAYPNRVCASVGVHPHDAKHWDAEAEVWMREAALHPGVVAIGEIGLDFHYDFSPRPAQFEVFRAQMRLAQAHKMPVILHCREAYPETLSVLAEAEFRDVRGVMHCWAGSVEQALHTAKLGYALGFGGTLTFKNAQEVRDSAQAVPLETLLVETDAPYLAPMPHRGKRNEPAYTRLVAERLAELRGLSFEALARLTAQNALRVFARMQEPRNAQRGEGDAWEARS
jgi:TatD DNase family protein